MLDGVAIVDTDTCPRCFTSFFHFVFDFLPAPLTLGLRGLHLNFSCCAVFGRNLVLSHVFHDKATLKLRLRTYQVGDGARIRVWPLRHRTGDRARGETRTGGTGGCDRTTV